MSTVLIVAPRRLGRRLGAPDETAGQRLGGLAVVVGLLAGDDRVPPAVGPLQQAPAAGRQVVDDLGLAESEAVEVDDVEIGAVPRGEHATVATVRRSRAVSRQWRCTRNGSGIRSWSRSRPQCVQQRGREAAVADRADVGAAVAEARHGVRVDEHLVAAVESAVDVVEERQVEQARARRRRACTSSASSSGDTPARGGVGADRVASSVGS